MNYANMIDEGNLKRTFIVSTLVSSLIGTFAASHNLYERLSQKKKDGLQDDKIKKLEEKVEQDSKKSERGPDRSDDLKRSLDSSGPLIRREYDFGYDRLGQRFAEGDMVTENELQRQIILLQQTVIGVLEDALYNGRQISRAGVERLVGASKAARNGSLDALQGQYQRILQHLPPPRQLPQIAGPVVVGPGARETPPPRQRLIRALPPPPPPSPREKSGIDFYCRYSVDLQHSPMPLARAFDPGRGSKCPSCKVTVPVDADEVWRVGVPVQQRLLLEAGPSRVPGPSPARERSADSRDRGRSRTSKEVVAVVEQKPRQRTLRFQVLAKFVVKCHTREGEYVCVLCCGPRGNYSGVVVLCDDPESLVDHIIKEHGIADIEKEVDILPGWEKPS